MSTRILLVDLQGGSFTALASSLGADRETIVATNPTEAIALLGQSPPFAVVVCNCDSRDHTSSASIAFLAEAYEHATKTTRILVVPRDRADVIFEAVNRDHIFAFLTEDSSS
ncbi:MAG: hypothetical protein EXS29_07425 [Pedosphaera sp.]|nr:hypothetical protein [Pedosphaera sp.]